LYRSIGCCGNPRLESWLQGFSNKRRQAGAMIFPGEIIIPAAPLYLVRTECRLLSRQAKIAYRDGVLGGSTSAITIGKGVELFDITQRQLCLPLDQRT